MNTTIAFGAGLLVFGMAGTSTVFAQPFYGPPPPAYIAPPPAYRAGLPPQAIVGIVRSAGLAPLTRPVRRDPRRYVLVAADARGQHLRVVIDAYGGRILRVVPVYAMRPGPRIAYGPTPPGLVPLPRHAAPPSVVHPEIKDPPPGARAPRDVVGGPARSAAPHPRVASIPRGSTATAPITRPRSTPLPRPRPAVAANASGPASESSAVPEPSAGPKPPAVSQPAAPEAPATAKPDKTELVPVAPLE